MIDAGDGQRRTRTGDGPARTHTVDDRGVSEVIAFVLVFGIIIGSVGVLYMTGFQSMQSYQETEQLRNAERAMEAFGANVDDVQRNGGIEEREGELALRGGTVSVAGGGTELNVTVDDGSTHEFSTTLGSITYSDASSQIAYEGGAIFRGVEGDRSQNVVLARPQLSCTDSSAMVSVLAIDEDVDERSVAGDDVGEVTVVHNETRVETFTGSDVDVSLEHDDSRFDAAWDRLLEAAWATDPDVDRTLCENVDTAVVRIVTVDVEL